MQLGLPKNRWKQPFFYAESVPWKAKMKFIVGALRALARIETRPMRIAPNQ